MQQPPIHHRIVLGLVVAAVVLPVAISVVALAGSLLQSMGDIAGGGVLTRIALAAGILWVIELICLVLTLAIGAVLRGPDEPEV